MATLIIILLFVAGVVYARNFAPSAAEALPDTKQRDSSGQIIKLGLKGARYTPSVITVESGKPVTLQNDGSLAGCALYVSQPQLGINANFMRNKEYTFTPQKTGTFIYTCSMGMYKGTINVV